jgi:outer membrane receptor protein involved in Fe transport
MSAASGAARAALAACAMLCAAPAAAQAPRNPVTETEGPAVEVVGITPVPGLGTALPDIPATVQSSGAEELHRRDARDLAEHLERGFAGVNLNSATGSPYQQDLQYRGFTASPLLGLPQGLSVFVDGVRVNEAFGDMVNWDLIPRNAIANVNLVSGSNPVFGLNTLGGVLTVQTKSGFAFPGTSARLGGGSFGRRAAEFEHGGHGERADWFVAANATDDAGWREHSSSRIRQAFAKGGWQDSRTDIDVSLALADNALEGTQALPLSMLDTPRQAYTWPDRAENALSFVTLRASRYIENDLLLQGTAYLRNFNQRSVASNVNEDFDPLLAPGPGNAQAFNDRFALDQRMAGASLQVTVDGEIAQRINRFTLGASIDSASADFAQDRQEAAISGDRETQGIGAFAPTVRASSENQYLGLYFVDQLALTPQWMLTTSARFNAVRTSLRDRSGTRPELDGDHSFQRVNPALGLNWNPSESATHFVSYSEGMRVPTPVELTCANPSAPCTLPNQFLADPPLKPVIARTLEAGTRLRFNDKLRASASLYRTELADDILFVSSGGTLNTGYFQNVGTTLRQGLDLTARASLGKWSLQAAYSYVEAQYLTPFRMRSPNNSTRDAADEIAVERGDRLPGIPADMFKLFADWSPSPRGSVGLGWAWFGAQYARGDENNQDANGRLPSYGIAQLLARFVPAKGWEASLRIDNLFDQRYENFGILGRNFFNGANRSFDAAAAAPEQFRSPGAPRAIWIALRYDMKR